MLDFLVILDLRNPNLKFTFRHCSLSQLHAVWHCYNIVILYWPGPGHCKVISHLSHDPVERSDLWQERGWLALVSPGLPWSPLVSRVDNSPAGLTDFVASVHRRLSDRNLPRLAPPVSSQWQSVRVLHTDNDGLRSYSGIVMIQTVSVQLCTFLILGECII